MITKWRLHREWMAGPTRFILRVLGTLAAIAASIAASWAYTHGSSPRDTIHAIFSATIVIPLWVLVLVVVGVAYAISWLRWTYRRLKSAPLSNTTSELTARLGRMQSIAVATETLLSAASSMTGGNAKSLENVLTSYLSNVYGIFSDQIRRLDVLVPKDTKLVSIARHRMPEETQIYDLNDTSLTPGLYVAAYRSRKIEIAHLYEEGGVWKCDHWAYKPHRPESQKPPHTTFAIVPMIDGEENVKGVICLDNDDPLDTNRKGIFDPPEMQPILTSIGSNLASVITIWENFGGATS